MFEAGSFEVPENLGFMLRSELFRGLQFDNQNASDQKVRDEISKQGPVLIVDVNRKLLLNPDTRFYQSVA